MERFRPTEKLFVAALTALAGFVDAVGFVQSKGFFVSFMSGNSTRLGVGIASSLTDALGALGLISSFILGVTAGSLIGRQREANRVPVIMSLVGACLAGAALLGMEGFLLASLSITALAMGMENTALEHQGRVRVGLTYMTGSVVKIGQALADRLAGIRDSDLAGPLLLWGSFLGGATAGALAGGSLGFAALWLGSGCALSFALMSREMFWVQATDN
ncbi:DUF1275 family protein [Sphingomonas sp. KRR8]|uniref:YoaK family protein n=1 Tax=Sphingomonas sp. KRR8 TaxID=2942996 RepID=UPI00201FBFCE|nr:DUF1275 family protein [Sphingomonas sp. KRR8]URD61994.1 DUF1275 family protein [Sphingomonas sp. KRR8]